MNKSIISWTNVTWNPTHGCSKVSDGCKHCYAMTLSLKRGWTTKPWTVQNESDNVLLKPHKLADPYRLKEPQRVFVNSMSDLFHAMIPDWYRAAVFCVMMDLPQHVFQILTKRPESTIDWPDRFRDAVRSPEFICLTENTKNKHVKSALEKAIDYRTSWAEHLWMGTSVEDSRVVGRIDQLRQCQAHVRFISAEPLIGALGPIDLTDIHWIIVGGESGNHMKPGNPRWMQQEWARDIKNQCVDQAVAYFYKQDSGYKTELRTWLVEEDGSHWKWEQYPNDFKPAIPALG